MPERHLYEYAVMRVVPRVEREEFLNVGVVLFCSSQLFLETVYHIPEARFRGFAQDLDLDEVRGYLQAFEKVSKGGEEGGPIGLLPLAERFRWLTAVRSTVLQTSPVHPGLCVDPKETLMRLYRQLVL